MTETTVAVHKRAALTPGQRALLASQQRDAAFVHAEHGAHGPPRRPDRRPPSRRRLRHGGRGKRRSAKPDHDRRERRDDRADLERTGPHRGDRTPPEPGAGMGTAPGSGGSPVGPARLRQRRAGPRRRRRSRGIWHSTTTSRMHSRPRSCSVSPSARTTARRSRSRPTTHGPGSPIGARRTSGLRCTGRLVRLLRGSDSSTNASSRRRRRAPGFPCRSTTNSRLRWTI